MRVLVSSDAIGSLRSSRAGDAIARGWESWPGVRATVLPVGEAGSGFVAAVADRTGVALQSDTVQSDTVRSDTVHSDTEHSDTVQSDTRPGDLTAGSDGRLVSLAVAEEVTALEVPGKGVGDGVIPYEQGSGALGAAMSSVLRDLRPTRLLVDLSSDDTHDGGAGLLAGLGAVADGPLERGVAGLADVTRLDLSAAHDAVAGTELVGVVPADQAARLLLGLRGITSLRGRAAGEDSARLLATDADLARWADLLGVDGTTTPGSGACGGVGLAVLSLGGRITTGAELALAGVTGPLDLVVTGCGRFDFASRGGGVVAEAARLAADRLAPCVVLAGEVLIGGREMRTMGVEAAYAVRGEAEPATEPDVGEAELTALAVRVARSWHW